MDLKTESALKGDRIAGILAVISGPLKVAG